MNANKQNRINDEIRLAIAELLPTVKDPRVKQGDLVSVVRAEATGDLRYCKVGISILGEYDAKSFRQGLKSASPWIRRELGARLNLRYTPELIFELDDSIARGSEISRLIEETMKRESPEVEE